MDKGIKDKRVEFRVPENEKKLWNAEAKARNISVGELIRNAVADFLGKIRDLVFVRKETIEHSRIVAISRLSNNLNQIARDLNSALKYGNPIDVLNTQAKLVEILNEAIIIEDCARRIENYRIFTLYVKVLAWRCRFERTQASFNNCRRLLRQFYARNRTKIQQKERLCDVLLSRQKAACGAWRVKVSCFANGRHSGEILS